MTAPKVKIHIDAIKVNTTVIRCPVSRGGSIVGNFTMDMVMVTGNPHVVFKGKDQAGGMGESVHLVAIDPDGLDPLPNLGEIKFMYRSAVEDPRPTPPAYIRTFSYFQY